MSIRLEQNSRSPTCFDFFPTAKGHLPIRNTDCRRIGCFKKRTLRSSIPKPSCLYPQTNTVAFRSTRMKYGWRAGQKLNTDWATRCKGLWHVNLLHEYRQARLKPRIDCASRGRSTYRGPTSHEPQGRTTIKKLREGTTFLPQARLTCSATGLLNIIQSYPVSDIFNPNRHLPHPPTSERCSDF